MGPRVAAAVRKNPNAQLVKINIQKWSSPVAKQYGIQRLPTVYLYRGNRKVATGAGAVLKALR